MMPEIRAIAASLLCATLAMCTARGNAAEKPVIAGYIFPRGSVLANGQIDAYNLTRINYAFAVTKAGRIALGSAADEQNLAILVALKRDNPSLTILISVGGWLGSGDFSDIALTRQSRKVFVDSVIEFLRRYRLDGLDIDWEYPGLPGAGNTFRAEDKENFTLLLKDLGRRFEKEHMTGVNRYLLTIAAGASDEYLAHTEMREVQRYIDAVNLMAYDYTEASPDRYTGHHAPLFADPGGRDDGSADASVHAFEHAGVPAAKIILGVPFYGRSWEHVSNKDHGLFQPGRPSKQDYVPFSVIATSMIGHGFTRYWDDTAKAPYLYNAEQGIFVSYEDAESLTVKCNYVMARRLGGMMFWEYSDDPRGELLQSIAHGLRSSAANAH